MAWSTASGTGIHFEHSGVGQRSIILIHEMGGSLRSWDAVAPSLEPHFQVVRYDQRGAGESAPVAVLYTIEEQLHDLEAVVETSGISAPFTIAGVAAGAGIALLFASRHPEQVSSLLFCCPSIGIDPDRRRAFLERSEQVIREGMQSVLDSSFARSYPEEVIRDCKVFETYRARFLKNDPLSYALANQALINTDIDSIISSITCPCLVLAGEHDRLRTPSRVCSFAKRLQNYEFDVIDGGHLLPVQASEALVEKMLSFALADQSQVKHQRGFSEAPSGSHFLVPANGMLFHCKVDGPQGAPWIVFSNSLMTDLSLWDGQVKELATKFRILRYDQRGHGGTDVPASAGSFDTLANDVVALLDLLGIQRAVLIGISVGCATALQVAIQYPERLSAVILCDGQWMATATSAAAWEERITVAEQHGMTSLVEPTIRRWFTSKFVDSGNARLERVRQMIRDTPLEGFKRCARALQSYDLRSKASNIKLPTLLIAGEEDGLIPQVMKEMHLGIEGSQYAEIQNAGHLPNIEAPEVFNRTVMDFLDQQSSLPVVKDLIYEENQTIDAPGTE